MNGIAAFAIALGCSLIPGTTWTRAGLFIGGLICGVLIAQH